MNIRGLCVALRAHIHRLPWRSTITEASVALRKLRRDVKSLAQLVVHQQLLTLIHREHAIDVGEFRRQARTIYVCDVRLDDVA